MKTDPAAALSKLITEKIASECAALRVAMPCRVLSFDATKKTANVQPLIRSGSEDPAPLQGVPVLGHRFMINDVEQVYAPSLHIDDVVLMIFADRDIRKVKNGKVATPESGRTHNLNDGVIVGVFGWSL